LSASLPKQRYNWAPRAPAGAEIRRQARRPGPRRAHRADDVLRIGREAGTTVTPDYDRHGSVFTGKVNWVQIDLGQDDHDHFISADERLRVAMARQ
jgi:hypothetical protein